MGLIPNVALGFTEPMGWIGAVAGVLLPGGIYLLLLSWSRRIGRGVLGLTFILFLAAFQLVLLYLYGRSAIAVDMFLNLLTTNSDEVGELLDNMVTIIAVVIALYAPPLTVGIVALARGWMLSLRQAHTYRWAGGGLVIAGLIALSLARLTSRDYNALDDLYPLNVAYNIFLAGQRTIASQHSQDASRDFLYDAEQEAMINGEEERRVVVLVIGETSRASEWQLLGYERPTTPSLIDRTELVAFPHAMSESNITHKSVPMLLSHLEAKNFNDSIYRVKSIISAFKEAGYHTAFLSNQRRNHNLIDHFGEEADRCTFVKEALSEEAIVYDKELLPFVTEELKEGEDKPLLIVLHTYGSHFSYNDRYPAEAARFTPDRPLKVKPEYREEMVNAYDNTILYTSTLLDSLMTMLEESGRRAALIYTSDHGEDIFDDGRGLFLHASPVPSAQQLHVPFLVWVSTAFDAAHPDVMSRLRSNRMKAVSSSLSFFHTAVDLGGIDTWALDRSLSLASRSYIPLKRVFLNDHNQAVTLDKCGFTREDYRYLRKHELTW